MACGSFVLNTPATIVLRTFLPSRHPRAYQRNYSASLEKEWEAQPSSSSTLTPFITRTTPPPSGSRSVSPMRAQTLPRTRECSHSQVHPHDIHPVMSGLEQQSKFCENKNVCSTCNCEGITFPQCGKCGDSWCSRECRLKGRMKHSCTKKSA